MDPPSTKLGYDDELGSMGKMSTSFIQWFWHKALAQPPTVSPRTHARRVDGVWKTHRATTKQVQHRRSALRKSTAVRRQVPAAPRPRNCLSPAYSTSSAAASVRLSPCPLPAAPRLRIGFAGRSPHMNRRSTGRGAGSQPQGTVGSRHRPTA